MFRLDGFLEHPAKEKPKCSLRIIVIYLEKLLDGTEWKGTIHRGVVSILCWNEDSDRNPKWIRQEGDEKGWNHGCGWNVQAWNVSTQPLAAWIEVVHSSKSFPERFEVEFAEFENSLKEVVRIFPDDEICDGSNVRLDGVAEREIWDVLMGIFESGWDQEVIEEASCLGFCELIIHHFEPASIRDKIVKAFNYLKIFLRNLVGTSNFRKESHLSLDIVACEKDGRNLLKDFRWNVWRILDRAWSFNW
ncbi:MAG: hypothetical protein ACRDF4_08350 [Rhabdochlamydiaceae bacterium]